MPDVEAKQQKVLLISDDTDGRAAIKDLLERDKASVLMGENWQQCISSARFIKPELILIDISDTQSLPGGQVVICRMLKEQAEIKDIPLIFVVGEREIEEKAGLFEAGAADVITKPFAAQELSVRVRVHLENRKLKRLFENKGPETEDANRSVSLLSDMSHDLRTPLNAIIGFTELMQQDPSLSTDNRDRARTINRSGKYLSFLINDLVEICRLQTGRSTLNMTPFDLEVFINDIEKMIEHKGNGKSCQIISDASGNAIRYILCDRERLARVILILTEYAVKVMKGYGIHIRLSTVGDDRRYKLIGEISGGNVADQGKTSHTKIPHTGPNNERNGTRHGLIIPRELLRCMGGSIEVTDDAQGNEKIYFELDVREGSVQPAETRVSHRSLVGTNNGEPIRVLVADDAEENCIVFSEILGHFGFDVRTVEDGREAVRVYEAWKPHIIMMDLRMPGMDGYEAAKMIRAKEDGQDPVIFAATGDVLESDVEKIRESGMDGYILKPYDERSIREKIGEFIKLSNASGRTDAAPFKDAVPENGSISGLPHGIVEKMQDAARNARLDILLEAVDESEAYNKSIAQRMRDLIKKYDYESIFEILGIKQ